MMCVCDDDDEMKHAKLYSNCKNMINLKS